MPKNYEEPREPAWLTDASIEDAQVGPHFGFAAFRRPTRVEPTRATRSRTPTRR
jgi:hypothetical protein